MESICIRCVRNTSDSTTDDVIRIVPLGTDHYSIKTTYGRSNKTYTQTITYTNVFGYVHSLVTLLIHDDMPFKSVQLDFPNTPSVMLNVASSLDCERVYTALNTMLHVSLDAWNLRVVE
jgi:hypothetical protein